MAHQRRVSEIIKTARGLTTRLDTGEELRIEACTPQIIRVRLAPAGQFATGGLERYGFIRTEWPPTECAVTTTARRVTLDTGAVQLRLERSGARISLAAGNQTVLAEYGEAWSGEEGFGARFALDPHEQFVGFGDQTRDYLNHRGRRALMWVRNVASYTPIPFFMSTRGCGLFVNSTWRHVYDMGASSDEWFGFAGERGQLDYYIIYGPDYPAILDRYSAITGRPYIPPLWSFGLWFVCHTEARARDMLDDCLRFREKGIPCDVVGLEPGWMEHNYDFTVDKRWHPERFNIPSYCLRGPHNFLNAAIRMGFKPSLWLCCDYDLSVEEERQLAARGEGPAPQPATRSEALVGGYEQDEHLSAARRMDTQTRPGQAWFDHLKPFVDQGVELFKQDGANQVLEHPDRKWHNGMDDEEMHNLYPLLYSRQMHEGFRAHTGRRATCFTPDGYAGLQKWTGTWAGDTGGGPRPLVSMLNLSLSGHSLMTCDMEVTTREGIHCGFLQPWAQLNSWNYWRQPWYQGAELEDVFRDYCRLRYELLPYLYATAHQAHRTGMPMLRAMPLMFPDDPASYELLTQYMLGDSLLVSAFSEEVYLPPGEWVDFWTGQVLAGGRRLAVNAPPNRGGGLYARAGSIIPMTTCVPYIDCTPWSQIAVNVVPGADTEAMLIEDDGTTYGYERGEVSETRLAWAEGDGCDTLRIAAPAGCTDRLPAQRTYSVRVWGAARPTRITLDGVELGYCAECVGEPGGAAGWSYHDAPSAHHGAAPLCLWATVATRAPHVVAIARAMSS